MREDTWALGEALLKRARHAVKTDEVLEDLKSTKVGADHILILAGVGGQLDEQPC